MVGRRGAKVWNNVRHDIRVYAASLKVQFKAAVALRGAFIAQVLGMILNNIALMSAWFFFFDRFGTVHGWGMADFVAMQGIVMAVFGVIIITSTGMMDTPRHVDTGSLDGFLTKPASVLGQLGSSSIDITTLGDILLGVGLVTWYIFYTDPGLVALVLFVVSVAVALVVFWCIVMILPNILAFYIFDAERISRYTGVMFLDGMNYPGGLFTGPLRTILLTILPALLVSIVPIDVLRGLHWEWVGFGVLIAAFWWATTMWLFRRALRRYESANLIGAR